MQVDLELVSKLQALDRRIVELRKEVAELPKQMAVIEKHLEHHTRQLDAAKAVLAANQKERKQRDVEIQTFQQKIAKLKDQMTQAKTNDQFRAFQNEIDYAQAEIAKCEERIIALMEEGEPLDKNVKAADQSLAKEKKFVETKKAEARERTAADQAELTQRAAERVEIVKTMPPSLVRAYENVKRKHPSGWVLSEATDGRCGACQIQLRPQVFQDVKSGQEMMFCDNCGRMLFYNPPVSRVSMS
jgi:uncharacterized protein